jgi:signal transduction histidine kinase
MLAACHRQKVNVLVADDRYYQKAVSFWDRQNDSAFYYFNKAANNSRDSLQTAKAYNGMAEIQSDAGDYFGSQESLSVSLRSLNEANRKHFSTLCADYNELGTNSLKLKNYSAAIGFYEQALKFTGDEESQATIFNNQANAYQKKKEYGQALQRYAIAIGQTKKNGKTYARILTNMAMTKWLQHPGYKAAPELLKALYIRRQANDVWGENSSYVHLAEYYTSSRPDSALFYARKMYTVATRLDSPDDRLDALQRLVRLSPPHAAKTYFTTYQLLNDSLQTARNASKNQFALVRYDTEKAKTENLRLQKDNTEKKFALLRKDILLYSSLGMFALLGLAAWLWYRKRQQQMALRFSQKVHDEVANGLYRVMKRVENEEAIEKGSLLDDIEALYERSRDISYEDAPSRSDGFDLQINRLLADLAGSDIKVAVVGNMADLWGPVDAEQKKELLQVLQELMVNMRKHSSATLVTLNCSRKTGCLEISYSDNGRGFNENFQQGNGLRNTVSRIQQFGGTVTFGNKEPHGASVRIVLPFS